MKYGIQNEKGEWLKHTKPVAVFSSDTRSLKQWAKKESAEKKMKELGLEGSATVVEISDNMDKTTPPSARTRSKKDGIIEKVVETSGSEMETTVDENYLFNEINEKCQKCSQDCKQSSKAQIVRCPTFSKAS